MTSPNTTTTGLNATDSSDFTQHSQVNGTSTRIHSGLSVKVDKIEYFRNNYDVMTGVRIAATLGGFFLFVLLSLIYKSKCKNKDSRPPSPAAVMEMELNLPLTATMIDFVSPESPPLRFRNFISPAVLLTRPNSKSASEEEDEPSSNHNWLDRNIDIHVILPTPTISPSGSENFRDPPPPALSPPPLSHPMFFLENLKYVDDTSSENIVTADEGDSRSIGSDSVFALFRHDDDEEEDVCRMVLTQAEVHHRESFDSFHEEEYLERSRRRSSSTQTTFSDLRQCLLKSYPQTNSSSNAAGRLLPAQHLNTHSLQCDDLSHI